MPAAAQTDYASILTEFIQKQFVIFGPHICQFKLKDIKGITIDKDGVVKKIEGDPQKIFQDVSSRFLSLSEYAVKQVMEDIVVNHSKTEVPQAVPALPTENQ